MCSVSAKKKKNHAITFLFSPISHFFPHLLMVTHGRGIVCDIREPTCGKIHFSILKAQKVQNLVTTKSVMEYKISEGMKK